MGTYPHHRRVQVAKTVTPILRVSFCPLPEATPLRAANPDLDFHLVAQAHYGQAGFAFIGLNPGGSTIDPDHLHRLCWVS
jgi:hypothetical protein